MHRGGQGRDDLLVIAAQIQLAGTDPVVQPGDFGGEGGRDEQHRQNDDQRDAEDGDEGCQSGAVPRKPVPQAPVERGKDHRQYAAPENRCIKGQQDADECDRNGGQQQQKTAEV